MSNCDKDCINKWYLKPRDLATDIIDSILGSTKGGQLLNSSSIQSISIGTFLLPVELASFTNSLYNKPTIIVTKV